MTHGLKSWIFLEAIRVSYENIHNVIRLLDIFLYLKVAKMVQEGDEGSAKNAQIPHSKMLHIITCSSRTEVIFTFSHACFNSI
jgi:hypothetical protein